MHGGETWRNRGRGERSENKDQGVGWKENETSQREKESIKTYRVGGKSVLNWVKQQ